jgi:hypothetical protein
MSKAKTGMLVVAGCAAACVGVSILPAVLTGAAAGGAMAFFGAELYTLAAVAMVGAGLLIYIRRKGRADGACACTEDAGCKTSNSCVLPREGKHT